MDYMTRRANDYKELVAEGILTGKLTCVNWNSEMWELECYYSPRVTRERARELVTSYLQRQWDGHGASFVVRAHSKPNTFLVRFYSSAL